MEREPLARASGSDGRDHTVEDRRVVERESLACASGSDGRDHTIEDRRVAERESLACASGSDGRDHTIEDRRVAERESLACASGSDGRDHTVEDPRVAERESLACASGSDGHSRRRRANRRRLLNGLDHGGANNARLISACPTPPRIERLIHAISGGIELAFLRGDRAVAVRRLRAAASLRRVVSNFAITGRGARRYTGGGEARIALRRDAARARRGGPHGLAGRRAGPCRGWQR